MKKFHGDDGVSAENMKGGFTGNFPKIFLLGFALFLTMTVFPQSQVSSTEPSSADKLIAEEEFRRGVQAYYRGSFNDSLMVFEKALSYVPGNPLILDWLGRAYFRTGAEGTALQHWEFAAESGYGAELLQNRIEIVRERRTIRPSPDFSDRYVETGLISAVQGENTLFSQPVSLLPSADGTFWAAAYGSNELIRFDVNGKISARVRGPVSGFDRPFDILYTSGGNILVSEVAADRISVLDKNGFYVSSFGEKGRGEGQFLGPQYMTEDGSGNIYVSDFGNARICVFNSAFEPLFSFGKGSSETPGFSAPSGVACIDGMIYAADSVAGSVYVFDTSGNYISTLLPSGSLPGIESLRAWKGSLIAAVKNRAVAIDPVSGAVSDLANLGNVPVRIITAVPDVNGNILLADYEGNCIQVASKMSDLAGGLFVQIERINADRFPLVTVDVRVEDRNRRPITGLKDNNFILTEDKYPASDFKLVGAGFSNDNCDISVLIDRSAGSDAYLPAVRSALKEISEAVAGRGTLTVVSAGEVPVLEGSGNPRDSWWEEFTPAAEASSGWRFDLGLRLAANGLVNASPRRAVIYLSSGEVSPEGFAHYGLDSLTAYLQNNGIVFSAVNLRKGSLPDEYTYIADFTGGKTWYVYREQGLSRMVEDILEGPNGFYSLSFESLRSSNFGEAYLPVEVEVYLMNRSGRDEIGYFAPLQ